VLLAIDVGNTHVMVGVYQQDKIIVYWRLATRRESTEDELGMILKSLFLNSHLEQNEIVLPSHL